MSINHEEGGGEQEEGERKKERWEGGREKHRDRGFIMIECCGYFENISFYKVTASLTKVNFFSLFVLVLFLLFFELGKV